MKPCVPEVYAAREKQLGLFTSIISGTLAYVIMYVLELMGVSTVNASLIMTVITNALGYILDVVIAKQCFAEFNGDSDKSFKLSSLQKRVSWLLKSLLSFAFIRFLITMTIDIIVSRFMFKYLTTLLNYHNVLMNWRWRYSVAALFISFVNFNLFVNIIRFDWAYSVKPDPALDLIMFSWFSRVASLLTSCPDVKRF
jgi:hypothetical protein